MCESKYDTSSLYFTACKHLSSSPFPYQECSILKWTLINKLWIFVLLNDLFNVVVNEAANEADVAFTGEVFAHTAASQAALWPLQLELHEAADAVPTDLYHLDPSLLLLREFQYDLENLFWNHNRLKIHMFLCMYILFVCVLLCRIPPSGENWSLSKIVRQRTSWYRSLMKKWQLKFHLGLSVSGWWRDV